MSLQPQAFYAIPEETVRVAKAAFPHGNTYMRMRDELGEIYGDQAFAAMFPTRGQPAEAPARLALISIMQFAEGLSDRQTAEAVRSRIDWKYTLGLELGDAGFDASVLSEFRSRLIAGHAEQLLFETMLNRLRERGLVKARGRQRTDSTHVLAAVRTINRLECVGETMRHALNTLASLAPDWLRSWVPAPWFARYERRFEEFRLPAGQPARYALAETIGADGFQVLTTVYAANTPGWLREIPAVETLRRVWLQQFYAPDGPVRWRVAEDLPPGSRLINSPYDPDSRYSKKRTTEWTGYKVHLTEACDHDQPLLVTDVTTTPATTTDYVMLPTIQAQLAARELLPAEQIVDAGYVTADHLVSSQTEHAVTLLGPVNPDLSWQAKAQQGFDVSTFAIDWDAHLATCPRGNQSSYWLPGHDAFAHAVIHIRFARNDCLACPARAQCVSSATEPRALTVRVQASHEALQAARQRQTTEAFKETYAMRAGIEGTISQAVRTADLRRSRYIGFAKTRLHHLLTATAINLQRASAWLADIPRAASRVSAFAALAPSRA